jgi:hypothetical protein
LLRFTRKLARSITAKKSIIIEIIIDGKVASISIKIKRDKIMGFLALSPIQYIASKSFEYFYSLTILLFGYLK